LSVGQKARKKDSGTKVKAKRSRFLGLISEDGEKKGLVALKTRPGGIEESRTGTKAALPRAKRGETERSAKK